MVVDKSLYNAHDIASYLRDTWVEYGCTFQHVERVDDDGMLYLSPMGEWVDFEDVEVCVPDVGLFEHKGDIYNFTLEPVRQWKKSFRTSRGLLNRVTDDSGLDFDQRSLELSLLTFKPRTYEEAYTNVRFRSKRVSLINREWFLGVSADRNRVELFHYSNVSAPVAQAFRTYLQMYTPSLKPDLGVEVRYE